MSILDSARFARLVAGAPLVVVDAGARGGLGAPWRALPPGLVHVIGFEPDPEEAARLNASAAPGVEYVGAALWNSEGTVELHVAEVPSTSSIHRPDDDRLMRYEDRHRLPRRTSRTVEVAATTLDQVLEERGLVCDFLKVDVQGAELEVLQGGSRALDHLLGAVIETWTVPVHLGQGLTGDVLRLLASHRLDVFDIGAAAAWHRQGAGEAGLDGRRQVTGIDVLALRDPPPADALRIAKAAAIAEVYGFLDVASAFLAMSDDSDVAALRSEISRPPRGRLGRLRRRFATLHE